VPIEENNADFVQAPNEHKYEKPPTQSLTTFPSCTEEYSIHVPFCDDPVVLQDAQFTQSK
jgi:hypothetical protein